MNTALWWVRRDMRLSDNQALAAALAEAERVIPVYVLDEQHLAGPDTNDTALAFLLAGLRTLDEDLRSRGSRLIVRRGDPLEELAAVRDELGAGAVFAQEAYSSNDRQRYEALAETLPLRFSGGLTVHLPDALRQEDGQPYTVFTPFSRAWQRLSLPQVLDVLLPPERLAPPPEAARGVSIPREPMLTARIPFLAGEAEAQRRLRSFVDGADADLPEGKAPIYQYDELRNRLDLDGTSKLSPYLNLGMLSIRQAVVSALSAIDAAPDEEARYSAELWLEAIIRREYAIYIEAHYPEALTKGFRAEYRNVPWEMDQAAFEAWRHGRTGYPLVDAAMRQLVQTGWLPNRARLVAASFLSKDLLLNWRWGEQFFMQHLVDGDSTSNNEGWQRAAGIGTGAAPYLSILNPVLQGRRYDPDGVYVRRWLPELAKVPVGYIHQPWSMSPEFQREAGCIIGLDYPAPILDHGWARERAMTFFGNARQPMEAYRTG
jgi:deoxyribodipyrimidine photo-lyase